MIDEKRMSSFGRARIGLASLRAMWKRRFGGLEVAEAARRTGDLPAAIAAYQGYLQKEPWDAAATLRLARILDDAGRVRNALEMTRKSLALRPSYAPAEEFQERLERDLGQGSEHRDLVGSYVWPLSVEAYSLWRRESALTPPSRERVGVLALVATSSDTQELLNRTLASLYRHGVVDVLLISDLQSPSKAAGILAESDHEFVLHIHAGAVLASGALEWLAYAATRHGAMGAVADHDQVEGVGECAPSRPVLSGHPSWLERQRPSRNFPVLLIQRLALLAEMERTPGPLTTRIDALFADERDGGRLVHVPLVLSTLWVERVNLEDHKSAGVLAGGVMAEASILAVIPTKDRVEDLMAMIDSLRMRASRPQDFRIRVVDNRSRCSETLAYLQRGRERGLFDVLTCDEPFNWSRLNNLAAFGDEPIILFANNDMVVESTGWDDQLRRNLARKEIGIVGAKLTYPTGSLQHGGVLLGGNGERPYHEGVGIPPEVWISHPRWNRRRVVAAVTGAFMALRRDVFEAVGRFNEALPVAYNDVDMCLRVRAEGLHVLYDPELHIIHGESLTRGKIITPEDQLIDERHFQILKAYWPENYNIDPSVNPSWEARPLRPFRYLIRPSRENVLAWIDQARSDPWRSRRKAAPPGT